MTIENKKQEEIVCNSKRVIQSLSRGNYNIAQAMFEFGDNSIDAMARELRYNFVGPSSGNKIESIVISDNGSGFTGDNHLENSIVLGASCENRDEQDIGEFGVGMKAAAFALGDLLTIVSLSKGGNYCAAILDMSTDRAMYHLEDPSSAESLWRKHNLIKGSEKGTTIIIEKLHDDVCRRSSAAIATREALSKRYFHHIKKSGLKIFVTENGGGDAKSTMPLKWKDPLFREDPNTSYLMKKEKECYRNDENKFKINVDTNIYIISLRKK